MSRRSKAAEFLEYAYDVTVTGRNVLVTEGMKNYAIEKISKIERFSHRIIDVNVIMDIQKLEHRVDMICWVDNVKVRSSASTDDMYASIDKAVDKLTVQLRKHKNRVQDHHSTTHEDVAMNVNIYTPVLEDEILDYNENLDKEHDKQLLNRYSPRRIVSTETKALKTLNHEEAILKMDLSDQIFMIFRSEEDRKIKVIYRRDDGNYGIIEPEK